MTSVHFFRKKDTEIRKVALVDEDGNKTVVAIIGQVEELVEMGVLEPVPGMNEQAWVLIDAGKVKSKSVRNRKNIVSMNLIEFDSLSEAKQEATKIYKDVA